MAESTKMVDNFNAFYAFGRLTWELHGKVGLRYREGVSTTETSLPLAETEPRLKPGFPAQDKTLEYLTDPKVIASFLHRYQELTDEAFDELVNDIGYRAALLVLRAKALSADVRALDLYIRLCREDKDARRKREAPVERNVHATSFVQAERVQVVPDPPNNNPE